MMQVLPLALLIIFAGFAVGSFLAVVAERLPLDEDIVRRPSHCRSCQTPLRWRDLIPVVAYLRLNGQCSTCKHPIPRRLFYIEIIGGGLGSLAIMVAGSPLQMALGAVFLWVLLGLLLCDLAAFRLPDFLTGALFITGLGLAVEHPGRDALGGLIAAGAGAGTFWAIRIIYKALRGREGLGLGDVKLMAGIGAGLGLTALPMVALVAALAALAITALSAHRQGQDLASTTAVPFGAYLAGAAGAVWLVQTL